VKTFCIFKLAPETWFLQAREGRGKTSWDTIGGPYRFRTEARDAETTAFAREIEAIDARYRVTHVSTDRGGAS
jgi:hypothetical protein